MAYERSLGSFDTTEMTHLLDGGAAFTAAKQEVMDLLKRAHSPDCDPRDAVLRCDDGPDLTREQARIRVMQKIRRTFRKFMEAGSDLNKRKAILEVMGLADPAWATRNGVHYGLFMGAVTSQGDEEQLAEWLPPTMTLQLFGCFAMTEVGHGSFTRGVETTATFIRGAGEDGDGEFEIHTPTVTATKWWIGGAAHTATHAAVYAHLILDGRTGPMDYGLHVFIAQLRDPETGRLLKGVRAGDCGEKVGRHGIDNGWIQFDRLRIPRRQMLMRIAAVSKDGAYSRASKDNKSDSLAYAALVMGRATMVVDSANWLKLGLTIAVRYCAVRRQGEPRGDIASRARIAAASGTTPVPAGDRDGRNRTLAPSSPQLEPQLLEYATVRRRLMPLCAAAIGLQFAGQRMSAMYERLQQDLEDAGDVSELPAVHAASASLKAFCTWLTNDALEVLRQQLGGHGYSAYNALGAMRADFAVQCTWEGDNTVLALQTARALMAAVDGMRSGSAEQADAAASRAGAPYLAHRPAACTAASPPEVSGVESLTALLDGAAVEACNAAATRLRSERARLTGTASAGSMCMGGDVSFAVQSRAWDAASPLLVEAARAHVWATIFRWNVAQVKQSEAEGVSSGVIATLWKLASLLGVWRAKAASSLLLSAGALTAEQLSWLEDEEGRLCDELRTDAVALTDAFGYSDEVIRAPLGRADGKVYGAYVKRALESPGATAIPDYRATEIQPLLNGDDLTV